MEHAPVHERDNGALYTEVRSTELDDRWGSHTVIDVVQRQHGISRVVDDKRTAQAVTVLWSHVSMVPERPCLIVTRKLVEEATLGYYRALRNECRAIGPHSIRLEETVPMLVTSQLF